MDYILHIDTAADTGNVAIGGDGTLLAIRSTSDTRNYASVLNGMIDDVLAEAGISLSELSAVAICAGPGSYTGLRIGMATAKALCYVLDKPLLADNKLTLLANQEYRNNAQKHHNNLNEYDLYIAILPARDQEYYITIHNNKFECIVQPQHVFEVQLSEFIDPAKNSCLIVGTIENLPNILLTSKIHIVYNENINYKNWIFYSFEELKCNKNVILSTAEPSYLKQVYTHK